ncbi:MAG: Ppx/GppA family phosphatase [Acidobacteriales bacterium]|nr:Ppx/GppA family phosphatase [Terriglobales bacterium]
MRILAAVDIGSNSVRLKIAKLVRSRLDTLHEDREVTRLGESVFRNGTLSPEAIANTVKVLERFRRACKEHRVDQVRVVATSATRDAKNASTFSEWVRRATGWKVEVISGLEEGRLIHLGTIANSRGLPKRVLFFDLGGGSCEITLSEEGHIRQVFSLPLGAVRLTQEFIRSDPPTAPEFRRMHDYVREELVRVATAVRDSKPELTIATSGTAAALNTAARQFERKKRLASDVTTREATFALLDHLSVLGARQRAELPGINARRAEIIVAGAMVFAELLRTYDLPAFRYSARGLRDGILAQMAAEIDDETREFRQIEEEREDAILAMCKRYSINPKYAVQVRLLAREIFNQLVKPYGLSEQYGPILDCAAMLHECGYYVNRSGRHRHTWYLLVHSEIFGFDQYERLLLAAVARYMGKSRPEFDDRPLRLLTAEDRAAIPKLVAILRMARALNQSRRAAISHVRVRTRTKSIIMALQRRSTRLGDLEVWAAEKERPYFETVFERGVLFDF